VSLIIWVPQTMLIISRCLFAWSFDRLIPEKVAQVNENTHAPTIAVSIIVVLGLVSVFLMALFPSLTALVGLLGLTFTLLSVAISGILFPYRQKETFEGSTFRGRIAGIPVVSIVGVLSLVGLLIIVWALLTDVNSGTSWATSSYMVLIAIGIYLSGLLVYLISRFVQRARGVNVDLAYREIPPE
jgi:basic amino acid/polyamine antiporter, APA family